MSKQANALNAKTQADPKTGEVTAEEAKKAAVVAKAAEDSAAVAQSQLALAESEVKVEQFKIAAAKNLIEPDSVTA